MTIVRAKDATPHEEVSSGHSSKSQKTKSKIDIHKRETSECHQWMNCPIALGIRRRISIASGVGLT